MLYGLEEVVFVEEVLQTLLPSKVKDFEQEIMNCSLLKVSYEVDYHYLAWVVVDMVRYYNRSRVEKQEEIYIQGSV